MNTVGLTMPYIICAASRSFMLFAFASHAFLCIAMSFAISKIKANRCYLVSLSPAFSGLLNIKTNDTYKQLESCSPVLFGLSIEVRFHFIVVLYRIVVE